MPNKRHLQIVGVENLLKAWQAGGAKMQGVVLELVLVLDKQV